MAKADEQCAARQVSDQMFCAACGLRWDANDPDRPACNRKDRLANGDPKLTPAEVRALKLADEQWLNRRQGGYRGRGTPLVKLSVASRLLGLRMLMRSGRGGIRTTYQGAAWLARNAAGRDAGSSNRQG